jgi:hypothetical protein
MMQVEMPTLAPSAVCPTPKNAKRPVGQTELAAKIERAIRRATRDRVRNLKVTIDGCVTVLGRCGSFYCKQQAGQAAMAAMKIEPTMAAAIVDNQIEVR